MPDKEFDNLFRDKFKDAEVTPSANLWANIEKELVPSKKRTFPVYWMAAAAVTVAITTLLVFQKKEVIQLHGDNPIVQTLPETPSTDVVVPAQQAPVSLAKVVVEKKEAVQAVKKENAVKLVNNPIDNEDKKSQVALQPNQNNERLPIKQQDPRPIEVLPNKEIITENPIVTAQVVSKEQNIAESEVNERKGIRNVGDLVNFVVDKVDKRDKKLVRFNTDDDDNSSLIGINIGFLKFNKKNKDK